MVIKIKKSENKKCPAKQPASGILFSDCSLFIGEQVRHYQGCTNSSWWIYYKYSTLLRGISINIVPKVGVFPEAEGQGKCSLLRVQYWIFHKEGLNIYFIT